MFTRSMAATVSWTARLIALSAHARRCWPCICSANSAIRRWSSSGSPNRPPKPSMDLLYRRVGGGPLGLAVAAARVDDLPERAEPEDREQGDEAHREAERGDRDLLADRVRGDRSAGRGAAEHLDQERLLDARAAGRERTAAATALTPRTSSTFLTEPPMWKASSR